MAKQTLGKIPRASLGVLFWPATFLLLAAPLWAQPMLNITSPASGVTIAPGEVLNISVSASGTFEGVGVDAGPYPFPDAPALAAPPYQFSVTLPADMAPGSYYITAWGGVGPGQGYVYSGTIDVNVVIPPPSADTGGSAVAIQLSFRGRPGSSAGHWNLRQWTGDSGD
jgi:hypothetical protein